MKYAIYGLLLLSSIQFFGADKSEIDIPAHFSWGGRRFVVHAENGVSSDEAFARARALRQQWIAHQKMFRRARTIVPVFAAEKNSVVYRADL